MELAAKQRALRQAALEGCKQQEGRATAWVLVKRLMSGLAVHILVLETRKGGRSQRNILLSRLAQSFGPAVGVLGSLRA